MKIQNNFTRNVMRILFFPIQNDPKDFVQFDFWNSECQ